MLISYAMEGRAMRKLHIAIASCVAVLAAGTAAALPLSGPAAVGAGTEAGAHALALGGVAAVVHQDGDGNVLSEQRVHNRLLDEGEDFILSQVFMNGQSAADSAQIGAICLSASEDFDERTDAATFNSRHSTAATAATVTGASTIPLTDTRPCLTDASVGDSGQVSTVGPLTFTANNTGTSSNWKPDIPIRSIGICQGFSSANGASCTTPLFAAVNISDVTLAVDETLTVTYTFDMQSDDS